MNLNPLTNIEAQLRRVSKNSYKELSLTFRLSSDEYTQETEELFFWLFESWKPVRLILAEEKEELQQEIPKERDPMAIKRQRLALNIKEYARQQSTSEEFILKKIYDTYWVTSRSNLTEWQLDECIRKYKPFTESELEAYQRN